MKEHSYTKSDMNDFPNDDVRPYNPIIPYNTDVAVQTEKNNIIYDLIVNMEEIVHVSESNLIQMEHSYATLLNKNINVQTLAQSANVVSHYCQKCNDLSSEL